MYFVYILRTSSNTLYTGQTKDLKRRLTEHSSKGKKGAKYTRSFSSLELVYSEEYETLSAALKRESEIKKLTKKKKEELIKLSGFNNHK